MPENMQKMAKTETDKVKKTAVTEGAEKELIAVFTPEGFVVDGAEAPGRHVFFSDTLLDGFRNRPYETLYDLGFMPAVSQYSPGLAYLSDIGHTFVETLAHSSDIEIARRAPDADDAQLLDLLRRLPFALGVEHVSILWLRHLWQELQRVFDAQIAEASKQGVGSVEEYLHGKNESINVVGRVFFHLVEHKAEEYPFAFLATYSTGTAQRINHLPLKQALREYKGQQDRLLALLSTVSRAADASEFISELVESGEMFSPLRLTTQEAYSFLREVGLYEECGIVCRIPDWWKRQSQAPTVSITVGERPPSLLGLDALLDFQADINFDGVELSREDIEGLLAQTEGLQLLKGKWVEVNHQRLRQVLALLDKVEKRGDISLADALRMQMGIGAVEGSDLDDIEVSNGEWLNSVREQLLSPAQIKGIRVGRGFKAKLRPYQQHGLNWLNSMKTMGFGALLADDMGLGKTVQVLAYLEHQRQLDERQSDKRQSSEHRSSEGHKALLVVPASLMHNWQREAARFAPKLRCRIVHTGNKLFDLDEADLFITTYGIAARLDTLKAIRWDALIIDEAQAIKNPGTKQTRAIKELLATSRIALTGTPIENRLGDLWSLFDFLNKGLLGTARQFTDFEAMLRNDRSGYARLRTMVAPFILRRAKTDQTIIQDLPEKIEFKQFTALTKKQLVLYRGLLNDLESSLNIATGMARRGLVLSSIMKFKQICNHPDQYLGQVEYKADQSGKFVQLAEICATVKEKREKVVIFTQFKEMCEPLARCLSEIFGAEGLILHGSTPVKARGKLVERFNSQEYVPFMVLSLKAGGVGLNLTSANHVIHFDRWWNPATENQATDRVFRIGQKQNVVVHKFVTSGTVEDKIDEMLTQKQGLADEVIASSGEAWITEMSNAELMRLFTLEDG
jgi:non-specific serine/threonine protein kinase